MQTFISTVYSKKWHKRSGTITYDLNIYRVIKNVPKAVASITYSTSSTRGAESEVMNALIQEGFIKGVEKDQYYHDVKNKKFQIICLH